MVMERYLRALDEYMNDGVKRMYGGSYQDDLAALTTDGNLNTALDTLEADITVTYSNDEEENKYNFSSGEPGGGGDDSDDSPGFNSPAYIDPNAQVPKTVNDVYSDIITYLQANPGSSDLELLGVMEEYSSLTGVTMDQLDRALADIGQVEPEVMTSRREEATALRDLGSFLTANPEATDADISNEMQIYSRDTGISMERLDGVIANALGVTAEEIKDRREAADPTLTPGQSPVTVTPDDTITIGDGDSAVTIPVDPDPEPAVGIAIEDLGFIGEGLQLEPNQLTTIDGQTYLTEEGQYQLGEFAKALRGEPNDFGITKEEAESVLQQGNIYGVPTTTMQVTIQQDPTTGEVSLVDQATGAKLGPLSAAPSGVVDEATDDTGGGGSGGGESVTEGGSSTGVEEETQPEDTQVGGVETTPEEVELAQDLSDAIDEGLQNLTIDQLNDAIAVYEDAPQLTAVDTDVLNQLLEERESREGVTLGDGDSVAIGGTGDDDDIIGAEGQDSEVTIDTGTIGPSEETSGEGDALGLGDTDTSGIPGVTDGPVISLGDEGEGLVGDDGTLIGTEDQTGQPDSSGDDGDIAGTGDEGPTIGGGPSIDIDDSDDDSVTIGDDTGVTIPIDPYDFGDTIVYDPGLDDFTYRQPAITSPFDFAGMFGSYTLSPEVEQAMDELTTERETLGFDPAALYEPDYLEAISAMSAERQADQGIASLIGARFPGAFGSYPFTSTPEQTAQALIDAMNAREATQS